MRFQLFFCVPRNHAAWHLEHIASSTAREAPIIPETKCTGGLRTSTLLLSKNTVSSEHGRQRRRDGGCIPQHFGRGDAMPLIHPPCFDELVSVITMSHSTECGLSFFLYEWWHLAVTYSTSHHSLEDRLLKLANTICYINGPRAGSGRGREGRVHPPSSLAVDATASE